MLTRYFSGNVPKPEERLLAEVQELGDNYAALLTCIKKYPVDVIRRCCDSQGNTVLHMVLMKHGTSISQNNTNGGASTTASSTVGDNESSQTPTTDNNSSASKRRWSWGYAEVDPAANIEEDLPKLLHYLIHCVYPEIDKEDQFEDRIIIDHNAFLVPAPAMHYNSLVRLQSSETGRLPLHSACASRHAVPLQALNYIVAAFPKAVQSPDLDGNLPLHVAAQNTAPLDVLKFLVQLYPEAVKTPNEEGNLPLHLAAAAETYKQEGPTENNNSHSGVAARNPSFLAASFGPVHHPSSPRRGVRRFSSGMKAPPMMMQTESPIKRSVRRTPSLSVGGVRRAPSFMAPPPPPPPPPLQRNEPSLTANGDDGSMSGAFTFDMATPQANSSSYPQRGDLVRTVSTDSHDSMMSRASNSRMNSPVRGLARKSTISSSNGSMMSIGSSTVMKSPVRGVSRKKTISSNGGMMSIGSSSTIVNSPVRGVARKHTINSPVRGVARTKSSSAPPMAAFQRKPLSKAAIDQRDVVKLLVESWPESVYETNDAGQAAEQVATASSVSLYLQECTATCTDNSNSNNPAGLEVAHPLQPMSFVGHHQINSNFKVIPISKERARSSFRVSSSPPGPNIRKNDRTPTAPQRKSDDSSAASLGDETSQEFTTVVG